MAKLDTDISQLNTAIAGILDEYNEDVTNRVKRLTKKAMQDLVKKTKATAPVGNRSRHYRDSITSKTLNEDKDGISKLWYVKGNDYRLSHLLNNGHALRDGGRYPGTQFISKAVRDITSDYKRKVEEELKND